MMAEQEEKISPEYLKGINNGYIIAKYAPDLAKELSNTPGDSPALQALRDGIKTFAMEKHKIFEPKKDQDFLLPSHDKDRERDIEPNI